MKVKQIATILNTINNETLGRSEVVSEDLSDVVSFGETIYTAMGVDNYVKALVNHIGRVIFVNRTYKGKAPNVLMDGWEYGSILEKIDCDMPDVVENESWELENDRTYNQDVFKGAKNVRATFFNNMTTFEVDISIAERQVKESFDSLSQLNAFFSMIETKIQNKLTLSYRNLIMRTINTFTAAVLYRNFSSVHNAEDGTFNFGNNSKIQAINLLGLYKEKYPDDATIQALDAETCITNLEFIKFAAYQMMLISDRLEDMSTLFNIGKRERFTPKDKQHFVLLSEFEKAANVFLQSDTFHEEYTALPESETITYWQGTGTDYGFSSTSKISVMLPKLVNEAGDLVSEPVKISTSGIIGMIFDHDALGVNNKDNRVPSHVNAKGEFINYFYKSDARYFNDFDENFVLFFVA